MAVTEVGAGERRSAAVGASVAGARRRLTFAWEVAAASVSAVLALASFGIWAMFGAGWILLALLIAALAGLAAACTAIALRRGGIAVPRAASGPRPDEAQEAPARSAFSGAQTYEMAEPLGDFIRSPALSANAISADLAEQGRMIAERLAAEQVRVTEALEIYGQSIETRLNLASVALAREFRDCGDALNRRVESAGEAAIGAISRQVDAIGATLGRSAEEIERRLLERSRDLLAHMESVSASTTETVALVSDAASSRVVKTVQEIAERTDAALRAQAEEGEGHRRRLLAALEEGARSLNARAETASGLLETKLLDAAAAIDKLVETSLERIETRIAARVESLSEKLGALDRDLDAQWTLRSRGLAEELSAAAQEVGLAAETAAVTAKNAFAESVQDSTQSWLETAEQATRRVESASAQAAEKMAEIERALDEKLGATVAQRIDATTRTLGAQSEALTAALAGVEGALESRGGALLQAIEAEAGRLDEGLATHRGAFDATLGGHVDGLARRAAEAAETLRGLAESHDAALAAALDRRQQAVAAELAAALAQWQERLERQDGETAGRLQTVAQELAEHWLGELRNVAEALQSQGGVLHAQIVARQGELIEALTQGVGRTETALSESLQRTAEVVETLAARIDSGLDERGQSIARTLERATQTLFETLTEGSRDTLGAIERGAAQAAGVMDASRRSLLDSVAGASQQAAAALDAGFQGHSQGLEARVGETVQVLLSAQARLEAALDRMSEGAVERLTQGVSEARQRLDADRERLVAALAEAARDSAEALARGGAQSRQALGEESARTAASVEAGRAALVAALAEGAHRVAGEFSTHTTELQRAMAVGADKLRRELAGPLGETLKRIEAEGVELASATRALAETLARTSAEQRDRLHEVFAREADALTATVTANSENFRRDFEAAVGNADGVFLSRGLDLARTLGARIAELKGLLEGEGFDLLKGLEARSESLSSQIEAASQRSLADFERKATGLINTLTRRGDDLLSAMTASASESSRKVGQTLAEVDAGTERAGAVLREIERKVGAMLTAVDRREAELALGGVKAATEGRGESSP